MNPGPWLAVLFLCVLPLAGLGLAFWAGVRYARYGWKQILPRFKSGDAPDGQRILSTRA